jgi:hypothetical protein
MEGTNFFVSAVLGLVALVAAGLLFVIGTGQIEIPRAERTWLAVLAGAILLTILGFAVFA